MAEPASDRTRERVARASRPLLLRLSSLPRLVVPVATLALIAVGLFAPLPAALPALGVLLVFLAWISYLAWPAVPTSGRVLRLAMLALVAAVAATRF